MEEYNDFIGPTPDQPPNDYDQYNRRHQQYSRSHSEEEEQIECDSQNFFAISAIFRMFFLIFAIIGIFASLLSKFQDDNGFFTSYVTLRIAFLVISTTIFAYEALILILDIINFFNLPNIKKLPINIILLIVDCLLLFGVLICSIFAFIKAEYIHQEIVITPWGPMVASSYFSAHAFFVMSIFGYLMSMLFVEEIIFLIFQIFAKFLADRKADRNRKRHSYY